MKMTYLILGIILTAGLIFYFTSCKSKSTSNNIQASTDDEKTEIKSYTTKENMFEELRNMAFSATPEILKLNLPTDKIVVYGTIMDWEMGNGISSTIAYQTGDASMYLSSGGGVIGGGKHENVSSAAKNLISISQAYLNKATKTETTPLPTKNQVKFYLLTNKGIYVGQEEMKNLENGSSPWMQLFEEENNVLTELRKTSEK